MTLQTYFDDKETQAPDAREGRLLASLPGLIAHARDKSSGFGAILQNIASVAVTNRQELAKLPVTRKSDLIAMQAEKPPFAGLNATPIGALARIFQSPGPIYDPEGKGDDWWRMGRAYLRPVFAPVTLFIIACRII